MSKVLIISPHPGFGGASSANQNIAETLGMLGHQVNYMDEYLTSVDKHSYTIDSFPIHKFKIKRRNEVVRYFLENKYDIIIIGVPVFALFYFFLFRRLRHRGTKICILFHSLSLSKRMSALFEEQLISFATCCSTHLLFVSEYTRVCWSKYYFIRKKLKNSFVVYNGLSLPNNVFEKKTKNKIQNISFVGRLSEEKDPALFCELARTFNENKEKYIFYVWGDGPLLGELFNRYGQYVRFMGYESNKSKIYSSTDILVMTSKFENCPMVILEAASYGIPCVAPKVGGIPEILDDGITGILFKERTISAIRIAISKLESRYDEISKNSKQNSEQYSVISSMARWRNVIAKVLKYNTKLCKK